MGTLVLVASLDHARPRAAGRNLGQRERPAARREGAAPRRPARRATLAAELDGAAARRAAAAEQPGAALPPDRGRDRATRSSATRRRIEVEPMRCSRSTTARGTGSPPRSAARRDPELRAAWEADPFATRCPEGESGQDVCRPRLAPVLDPLEAWLADGPRALRDRGRPQPRQPPPALRPLRLADARVPRPAVAGPGRLQHRSGSAAGRPVVRRLNAAGDVSLDRPAGRPL